MYNELWEVWKRELENVDLRELPQPDFYCAIADYIRKLREESRMLDKKTVKANLLRKEIQNVKRMVRELIQARYRKIINAVAHGEQVPHDVLTVEEEEIYKRMSPCAEALLGFATDILHGQAPKVNVEQKHKRAALRFLKDVPAIIGADMKTYGPFKVEDLASLPTENAKILIKQGLAESVTVG
jgi:DNA replication factor GINS